jgi:hypothetical protein
MGDTDKVLLDKINAAVAEIRIKFLPHPHFEAV